MRIRVEGRRGEEGHSAEGNVGEILQLLLLLLLLLGCAIIRLWLWVGVVGIWVWSVVGGGGGFEGRRTTPDVPAASEVGEVEVRDVEVAGVGFDGEVFVPFVLGGGGVLACKLF